MKKDQQYEIDNSISPPSCMPVGVDLENLLDITSIGEPWRRYLDTSTGAIHDGSIYYLQLKKMQGI